MGFFDNHPANCIASWQCPGTTGCGYPRFAVEPGCETGCRNLAVFSAGCNFECPFCQDWIHGQMLETGSPRFTDDEIVGWIDDRTTCVCFCGGTPDIHQADVNRIARQMVQSRNGKVFRVCAETNLTAPWPQLQVFARIAKDTGGGLNIGLKAGSDSIHRALTGASNQRVWRNLERLHAEFGVGDVVPFLRPSLLVVPGYVDEEEVRMVAKRLAAMDGRFTLKLIAFLPRYLMTDLGACPPDELHRLAQVARTQGLDGVSPSAEQSGDRFVR